MRFIEKMLLKLFYLALSLKQRATIGAQAIVIRSDEVLLVRHSYKSGWHLPGGGVAPPESPAETVVRELQEETGLVPEKLRLLGLFPNPGVAAHRDYLAIYVVSTLDDRNLQKSWEVAEIKWFPITSLPPDVAPICKVVLPLV